MSHDDDRVSRRRRTTGALAVAALAALTISPLPPTRQVSAANGPDDGPEHKLYLQDVAWSPDGRRFAFSRYSAPGPYNDKNWEVWVADRDGSHPRKVLHGAVYTNFSPDGKRLAAGMLFDGDWELVTVGLDGGDLRRLTHRAGKDELPVWSPDGKFIVYCAQVDGNFELYRIPAEGGEPVRLTTSPEGEYNPVFSRDGRRLVFYREKGDRHDQVWTLDLATKREARVTDGTGHSFFPSFRSDGRIYFSGEAGGERRLVVASADGKRFAPLGPAGIFMARWSPDGKEILFLVEKGEGKIFRMGADGQGMAVRLDTAPLGDSSAPTPTHPTAAAAGSSRR
jgi:Tol biopolymer transport system component